MIGSLQSTLAWFEALPELIQLLLVATLTLVVGFVLGTPLVRRFVRSRGYGESVADSAEDAYTILLAIVAVAIGLAIGDIGAMPSATGAVLAAATLSAGIGAREVLRNLVSGLFIVNSEDVSVGEWIEWDDKLGVVMAISFRVTKVQTYDGETVLVPNSKLIDDVVVTPVSNEKLRLRYTFGIGYDDPIEDARQYILEEAREIDNIAADPAPEVITEHLGPSTVHLEARVWITNPDHDEAVHTQSELIERSKQRLQEEGISLPAPQRDLSGTINVSQVGTQK